MLFFVVSQKHLWRSLRPSSNIFRHHKEVWKWKRELLFSFPSGSGREGLIGSSFRQEQLLMWIITLKKVAASWKPWHIFGKKSDTRYYCNRAFLKVDVIIKTSNFIITKKKGNKEMLSMKSCLLIIVILISLLKNYLMHLLIKKSLRLKKVTKYLVCWISHLNHQVSRIPI